jgi:hypothetical protein
MNWVLDTHNIIRQIFWRIELGINICASWEVRGGTVIDVSKDAHGTWEAAHSVIQ